MTSSSNLRRFIRCMSPAIFAFAVAFTPDWLSSYIFALGLGYAILQAGIVIVDDVREWAAGPDHLAESETGPAS